MTLRPRAERFACRSLCGEVTTLLTFVLETGESGPEDW